MTVVTLHTRLHPDALQAYDRLHARVPEDLLGALRGAGVHGWRIWRDGQDVFHVLEVDDYPAMRAALRDHPANVAWQAQVTPLQEVPDDYSGTDTGLSLVWSFADQVAGGDGAVRMTTAERQRERGRRSADDDVLGR